MTTFSLITPDGHEVNAHQVAVRSRNGDIFVTAVVVDELSESILDILDGSVDRPDYEAWRKFDEQVFFYCPDEDDFQRSLDEGFDGEFVVVAIYE